MSKQNVADYLNQSESEKQPQRYRAIFLAANIVVALFVLVMLLIWISGLDFNQAKQVKIAPGSDGPTESPTVIPQDADLDEPDVESPLDEDFQVTPVVLSQLSSSVRANMSELTKIGEGLNSIGDGGRKQGVPGPIIDDIISEAQRWQMTYVFQDRASYYRQIDFLGIELAAVDPKSPRIDYVSLISDSSSHRVGIRKEETRIGFRCTNVKLMQWDTAALKGADVKTHKKIVMQFYPDRLREQLLKLEKEKLDGIDIEKVKRTRFEVVPRGDSFRIRVKSIDYR